MLPIVQRELQVSARSRKFYAWRLRTGIGLVLLSIGIVLATRGGLQPAGAAGVFQMLCWCALLLCLAEGIRKTSDAISEEKRDGTIGLLFLTPLTGFDVVLGKFAVAAIRSLNALLAFVPVLAVSLLLGGVTAGEFWRAVLVLGGTLAASLALCLFTSTISRNQSLSAAGCLLFAICFLPLLAVFFPHSPAAEFIAVASPLSLLRASSDAAYARLPAAYWVGISWLVVLSGFSLAAASIALPHAWRDKARKPMRTNEKRRRLSPRAVLRRRQMLDRNPAMWLMFDARRERWLNGVAYGTAIMTIAALVFAQYILPRWNITLPVELPMALVGIAAAVIILAAYSYVAREASRNLAEARQNGALELVLSTPLTVDAIIQGQLLALTRALTPSAVVLGCFSIYILIFAASFFHAPTVLLTIKTVAESVLGIFTTAWFGMWMALTSKGATRAYLKTIAIGIVVPQIFCTPTIVNQIVLLVLAADKVKVHFRRYAADRYLQHQPISLGAVSAAPTAPPVLR